ncbi:MAG: Ppx/GppA phosphatase family protein [Cyclobacteriaceae bacterium]
MKIAIIDMGTNTFHLLITEVEGTGYEILHKERSSVRIGEKGINKGEIAPSAWDRAIETIKNFKTIIDTFKCPQTFATATSAVRNASNGKDLVDKIFQETGIKANVISGEKEAELILQGSRKALDLGLEKHLIMDIGGGSIEFIIANQKETFWLESFEIGGQRLVELFHSTDPISDEEIASLRRYFDTQLQRLVEHCEIHQPKILVGCSGTFDTLSDIYCELNNIARDDNATEYPLPIEAFDGIYQDILKKKREERMEIPGMIEMRVDMIVVATILISHLIDRLRIKKLRVSGYALKEGVLVNVIESVQHSITGK